MRNSSYQKQNLVLVETKIKSFLDLAGTLAGENK